MSKHAILSASGAHKWINCPPSARLEEKFPYEQSEYAAEGTTAHKLAEITLRHELKQISDQVYIQERNRLNKSEYMSPSMVEYIGTYTTFVLERLAEGRTRSKDAVIFLEQHLDFSQWVPDGFGTSDVVIISDEILEIIDLKYGKGVPVEAQGNPQMRLYALGALAAFDTLYDIQTVRMTICQPRLDSITTDEMLVSDLLDWANNYLKRRALLAFEGTGEFQAGDHCKFCRARFTCRVRAEENLKLTQMDFRDSALLSDEEIGVVLSQAERLKAWAADVADYALDQAENHGKKWPGFKLVEGRSNRKYTDEELVGNILLQAGYPEFGDKGIFEKALKGITAMEKLLGKKTFNQLLADYVIKPPGKPTLVPEDDPRPEISSVASAIADFADQSA